VRSNAFRDETWPGLIEHWFFGTIVMHRIPARYLKRMRWHRMWLSVAACGVMCRPPFAGYEPTVTWCPKCYPDGLTAWPMETDVPD
jgi:hypothetical protein